MKKIINILIKIRYIEWIDLEEWIYFIEFDGIEVGLGFGKEVNRFFNLVLVFILSF